MWAMLARKERPPRLSVGAELEVQSLHPGDGIRVEILAGQTSPAAEIIPRGKTCEPSLGKTSVPTPRRGYREAGFLGRVVNRKSYAAVEAVIPEFEEAFRGDFESLRSISWRRCMHRR